MSKARDALRERVNAAQKQASEQPGTMTTRAPEPLTPVAQAARDLRVGLEARVQQLTEELRAMEGQGATRAIDSTRIHHSRWSNRHPAALKETDAKFRQLRDDIEATKGNLQPIVVRPIDGREEEYEIACGHRRHAACLALGIPTNCIVRELSDGELVDLMEWENRDRDDLSAYETGISYKRQLSDGVFASLEDLANAKRKSKATISMLLAYAEIPDAVLTVLEDPRKISIRQVQDLRAALNRNAEQVLARAKAIRESGQPAGFAARLKALLDAKDDRVKSVEVKGKDGKPLVRANKTARGYQFEVLATISRTQVKDLAEQLAKTVAELV